MFQEKLLMSETTRRPCLAQHVCVRICAPRQLEGWPKKGEAEAGGKLWVRASLAGLRHEKQKWGTVELVELLETHKGLKTQRHRHHLNGFSRSPESAERSWIALSGYQ